MLTKPSSTPSHLNDESKMSRADLSREQDKAEFAFMKGNLEDDEFTALEWEQRERDLDRAWYDADEEGNVRYGNDDFNDDFLQGGPTEEERQIQEELLRKKKIESQPISRRTLNSADHDKWELNRMRQSGAVKMTGPSAGDASLLETDEERVILMVHDIKPPFLDGRIVFTKQTEAV